MFKHASIIPLIGGETIGQMKAFGTRPDYLLSYSAFSNNDSHLVNYLKDVPYILIDKGEKHPHKVDVINTVCPCAGLSSLSGYAKSDSTTNDWMYHTTKYVLEEIQPEVLWGENAPGLAGKIGKPVVDRLHSIARQSGYTMSIFRTKSYLHGLPQIRERSFYFFWRGNRTPLLNYIDRPLKTIEELFDDIKSNSTQNELTNTKIPSKDDPFYRYVLEELEGGIEHKQFYEMITKSDTPMDWLERKGIKYMDVAKWMKKNGYEKLAARCLRIQEKLDDGYNIMRRSTVIPKHHIGAFVGHYPTSLTHYHEDRYITYREAMSIMGMPNDFELLNPKKNLNHVCQNVPVGTATDIALEIAEYLKGNRPTIDSTLVLQYNQNKTHKILDDFPNTLEAFLK